MLLGRPSSTRGAYAAATWAVNESLRRTLIGCSGSCSVGSRRRDRVEDCCLLHATLAVLDRVRCYIRGCWRKSPRAKCRLSGQTPRTKGASERRKARGEEGDGETKKEVVGARSVATESVFSCYLEHRRRRLSLPVPRAASSRRPSGFRPRASCARPPPRPSACRPTASAQPGADTCLGAAAPPEKAAHMLVGAAAEKLRRACCAQSSGSDPCVARAHTAEWRAAREASCAHGHADASEWQGPVAGRSKGVNHGGREPPVAPRLVPGSCRPRATATRGHCGPAQLLGGSATREGAPRSTTRELATRNKVQSPSHFDRRRSRLRAGRGRDAEGLRRQERAERLGGRRRTVHHIARAAQLSREVVEALLPVEPARRLIALRVQADAVGATVHPVDRRALRAAVVRQRAPCGIGAMPPA